MGTFVIIRRTLGPSILLLKAEVGRRVEVVRQPSKCPRFRQQHKRIGVYNDRFSIENCVSSLSTLAFVVEHLEMSPIQVAQTSSPLFRLPAEIRFAIYELLDLPPIDNEQCRGLILSCRQAKHECERVSIRTTKAWLLAYKQDVLSQSELGVRILLPIITRTPVGMHSKFHTLRNLTLVVPGHRIHDCGYQDPKFFESLRPLNAIFSLWLDSLTLHFSGSLRSGPGHRMYMHIGKSFRRLFFVLESGLTYAHDPVGQKGNLKLNKYSSSVKHWRPQPAFIKKLVVSWDLTEEGLRSEDLVAVDGHCRKRATAACPGLQRYRVVSEDELLGSESRESFCRFRPSDLEDRMAGPDSEHKKKCLKCGYHGWDYRRYIRGLPVDDDERWL